MPLKNERNGAEWSRLLALLRERGIYYSPPERPILSRDGKTTARWMLDSLAVSMTPEGLELAGRCMLKLLERFNGRTIATMGTIGTPLLSSMVLQSGGRIRGLLVRKERKTYGSRKLFEGPVDKDEPVVIVDDSVSSGTTMIQCRDKLEAEGFRVEGGLCLVSFGWYGGMARMQELGYHMEAVYDIWEDFIYHMPDEPDKIANPTKIYPDLVWHEDTAPDGLHPAALARLVMDTWLATGCLLKPPHHLDQDYDAAGGVYVSVRNEKNIYLRHARDGSWHFPEETIGTGPHELVMACLKTAKKLDKGEAGRDQLHQSALAITFFSAMETCTLGELNNDRYGIVVQSLARPQKMGGALPRMPGITNAWEQFRHAWKKNAGLISFEPYRILRHDVAKFVEPGKNWQPTGVPKGKQLHWADDGQVGGVIVNRAYEWVTGLIQTRQPQGEPLANDLLGPGHASLFVTVYLEGKLKGCMGSSIENLEDDLASLCRNALADSRFPMDAKSPQNVAVSVSLLFDQLEIGVCSPQEVMPMVRFGQQALLVHQRDRQGMLLPFVATFSSLDKEAYALEVIDKAGITRPPYHWRRYECRTWFAEGKGEPRLMCGAFPCYAAPREIEGKYGEYAALLADYLVRLQRDDGALFYLYRPFQDSLSDEINMPRLAHGLWVMARASAHLAHQGLGSGAQRLTEYLLSGLEKKEDGAIWLKAENSVPSVAELSFLLLGLAHSRKTEHQLLAGDLARFLWTRIGRHGKVAIFAEAVENEDLYQDYAPGQVLLALGFARHRHLCPMDEKKLARAFDFYRHRFRYKRDYGQVSWMMQAFSQWWWITRDDDHAAFVFEIGDWILTFQDHLEGGFLNNHQPDPPGYTTTLYLEGLGVAIRMAEVLGEHLRADRYRQACARGFSFMDRLIIQERDKGVLPNPSWAQGGVRPGIHQSLVRTDFVQHTLSALLEQMPPVKMMQSPDG